MDQPVKTHKNRHKITVKSPKQRKTIVYKLWIIHIHRTKTPCFLQRGKTYTKLQRYRYC